MAFKDVVNNVKKQAGRANTLRHYNRGAEAARAIQESTGVYNNANDAREAIANRAYIPLQENRERRPRTMNKELMPNGLMRKDRRAR